MKLEQCKKIVNFFQRNECDMCSGFACEMCKIGYAVERLERSYPDLRYSVEMLKAERFIDEIYDN